MSKKPAFQFYPGDWRKDQDLSRASKAAKGLWMDILCLAFESEKRGRLITGKIPWTKEEIAYAAGGNISENLQLIDELLSKKILKIDKNNTFFSKRMVKDEKLSKIRREAGFKGGNPKLLKQNDNQMFNQNPTPSSSSSSSTSVIKEINKENGIGEFSTWETEKNNFLQDGGWIFKFCNSKHITVDEFDKRAKNFLADIELKEDFKNHKELQRHFVSWHNKMDFSKIESKSKPSISEKPLSAPLTKL